MSTEIDLAAIKARVEAATPGPWEAQDDGEIFAPEQDGWWPSVVRADMSTAASAEDAAFIASAREDVPALVAEVERLRGEVAELKTSLVELQPSSAADRAERAERAAESTKRAHDALAAVIERVRQAVSNHPDPCEVHPDDDAVSCGWKIAYTDVVKALSQEEM